MVKNKVQCSYGHYYNADKFNECPTCNPELLLSHMQVKAPEVEQLAEDCGNKKMTGNMWMDNKSGLDRSGSITQTQPLETTEHLGESQLATSVTATPVPKAPTPKVPASQPPAPKVPAPQPPTPQPPTPQPPASQPPASQVQASQPPAPQASVILSSQPSPLQKAINDVVNYSDTEDIKTVANWNTPTGIEPVVGWLVCVNGVYIGQCFNLKTGNNTVGRSMDMDVHLTQEVSVSRNRHCVITYEPDNQDFYLQQGDSGGLTYLNGSVVLTPRKMDARDTVKIGQAKFIFIPLCIDGFRWETYIV